MPIIKKIEIKNFRSIKECSLNIDDFNLFVGMNDVGKSNVLKAINLFFNGKTDYDTPFNFDVDYSKFAQKGKNQPKEIQISIDVQLPASYKESGGVKKWKKIWRQNGRVEDNFDRLRFANKSRGQVFFQRLKYMYVPAVKSKEYFKYLLSQLHMSMIEVANKSYKELNQKYSSELNNITQDLSDSIEKILGMQSNIQMPEDLSALFKDFIFSTTDKFVKNINLNQRGDGIKARHIPSILNFIQQGMNKNKTAKSVGYHFIWGFEEPENGVEFSAAYQMADELYEYSKGCQLLITTHSPAVYSKKGNEHSKCFIVGKNIKGFSEYDDKKIENELISEKMGFMPFVASFLEKQKRNYDEKLKNACCIIDDLTKKYQDVSQQIVIITEGKTDIKHIKTAFNRIGSPDILTKIKYYDFSRGTLGSELNKLLDKLSSIPVNGAYFIGIFDRDVGNIPTTVFQKVSNSRHVYRFNIPSLNNEERKTSDPICIEHYYTNAEIKKDTGKGRLYLWDDFDKFGKSLDGNWVFKDFQSNNSVKRKIIDNSQGNHLQKIKDFAEKFICSKDDFADYVMNHPEEFDFSNFQKIYDVVVDIMKDAGIIKK